MIQNAKLNMLASALSAELLPKLSPNLVARGFFFPFYQTKFHFILFYFILFYFILFYFILFYFILFYFIFFLKLNNNTFRP